MRREIRMGEVLLKGLKSGVRIAWVLIKIVLPVYVLIALLEVTGVMGSIAQWIAPVTDLIGLPGETSALLTSGILLNIYTAIGTIPLFDLTGKQVTLIATFLLFCHALITEGVIVKKMGANIFYISILRFALAFGTCFLLNLFL